MIKYKKTSFSFFVLFICLSNCGIRYVKKSNKSKESNKKLIINDNKINQNNNNQNNLNVSQEHTINSYSNSSHNNNSINQSYNTNHSHDHSVNNSYHPTRLGQQMNMIYNDNKENEVPQGSAYANYQNQIKHQAPGKVNYYNQNIQNHN